MGVGRRVSYTREFSMRTAVSYEARKCLVSVNRLMEYLSPSPVWWLPGPAADVGAMGSRCVCKSSCGELSTTR